MEVEALPLPPVEFMKIIGSPDTDHFLRNAKHIGEVIAHAIHVGPESRILDLGCGCGRLAMGLAPFLKPNGHLYGIDSWPEGIAWCNEVLKPALPYTSEFVVLDVQNNYYHASDNAQPNTYNFTVTGEYTGAFAISLFTHLRESEIKQYFEMVRRTMKSGSKALLTFFVIDDEFFAWRDREQKHQDVKEKTPGCYEAYELQWFFTGYSQQKLRDLFAETDLIVDEFWPGLWCQKKGGRLYQDTFIVRVP